MATVTIEDNGKKLTKKFYDSNKVLEAFNAEFKKISLPIREICIVKYEGINDNGRFVFQMELKDNVSIEKLKKCFDFKVYYLDKNGRELNNEQKAAYIKYLGYKEGIPPNKNAKNFTSEATLKDYFFKGFFSAGGDQDRISYGFYDSISLNYAYNKDIETEIDKTKVEVSLDPKSKKIVVCLMYYLKHNVENFCVYVKNGTLFKNGRDEICEPVNYYEYFVDAGDHGYIHDRINNKNNLDNSYRIECLTVPKYEIAINSNYKTFTPEEKLDYKDIINNYNSAAKIKINGTYPKYDDFLNNKIDSKIEQEIVNKWVKVILDYVNKQDLVKIRFFDDKYNRLNTVLYNNSAGYLEYYVKAYCSRYISEKIKNMPINRNILLDIVALKEFKAKEDDLFDNTKVNSLMAFLKEVEDNVKNSNKLLCDNWDTIISVIVTKGESKSLAYLFNIRVINDSKYIYKLLLNTIKEHLVHFYIKFEEAPECKKLKQQYSKLLSKRPFSVLLPVTNTFKDDIFVKYFNKMLGEESCLDVKNIDKIYEDNFFKTPVHKPLNDQTYILKFKSDVYEDINKNNNAIPVDNKPKIEPKLNIELNPKIEQKLEMKPIPKLKEIKSNNDTEVTKVTKVTAKFDTSEINEINEIKKPVVITENKNNTLNTPRPLPKIAKETFITKTPVESSDIKKTEVIKEIRDTKKTGDVEGSKEGRGTKKTKYGKNKTPSTPSSIDDKKPCCCNKCCCKCC